MYNSKMIKEYNPTYDGFIARPSLTPDLEFKCNSKMHTDNRFYDKRLLSDKSGIVKMNYYEMDEII